MKRMWKQLGQVWKSECPVKAKNPGMAQLTGRSTWPSLVIGLAMIGMTSQAYANSFAIRPIQFVAGPTYSMTATGTIDTVGNTSNINDWNLTVTTFERLARYTKANTANLSAGGVSSDGTQLTVATSPDGIEDGGSLFFRSPSPFIDFGVQIADFTGGNVSGGQAMYMAGAAFDFVSLGQPNNSDYPAASSADGKIFNLAPLAFSGGAAMHGTITTDGTTGALDPGNILAWDIYVDLITRDVFDKTNSTLLASKVGLSATGLALTVDNPDGYLAFSKGFGGGHPYSLQLADFTTQPGGQAGYLQGRLAVNTIDLGAGTGPWTVTGTDPVTRTVPAPATMLLFGAGMAGLAVTRPKRKRRHCSR